MLKSGAAPFQEATLGLSLKEFFPTYFQLSIMELVIRCSSFGFNRTVLRLRQRGVV